MEEEIGHVTVNQNSLIEKVSSVSSSVDEISSAVTAISNELSLIDIGAYENRTDTGAQSSSTPASQWPTKVYLTFDDGPSANTGKILDILKRYKVKGNFFVVGTNNPELRSMYKRIVDEGHVLCMHSYTHKYNEIYSSVEAFTDDLDRIYTLLYEETGQESLIYRFPGGSSNSVSSVAMSNLCALMHEKGYEYFDWNISSQDATSPAPSAATITANVLSGIDAHETAIVLMHDAAEKNATVAALPGIIEGIKARGDCDILPIDDDTQPVQHLSPVFEEE